MTRTPELQKLLNDWLVFAGEILLVAKHGMKADFAPYHTICFMCQGSAEKYLKAYLISRGWELKRIHDLDELTEDAVGYDKDLQKFFLWRRF